MRAPEVTRGTVTHRTRPGFLPTASPGPTDDQVTLLGKPGQVVAVGASMNVRCATLADACHLVVVVETLAQVTGLPDVDGNVIAGTRFTREDVVVSDCPERRAATGISYR